MRIYLYGAAGIVLALWLSLEILGAAGFVAFVIGMLVAQGTFRLRPSLNAAFVAGIVAYGLTLVVWSVAIGPPQPTHHAPTATASAPK